MGVFEELSRANLIVGTRRLKWFTSEQDDHVIFYDAFWPTHEVRVEKQGTVKEQILEARKRLKI